MVNDFEAVPLLEMIEQLAVARVSRVRGIYQHADKLVRPLLDLRAQQSGPEARFFLMARGVSAYTLTDLGEAVSERLSPRYLYTVSGPELEMLATGSTVVAYATVMGKWQDFGMAVIDRGFEVGVVAGLEGKVTGAGLKGAIEQAFWRLYNVSSSREFGESAPETLQSIHLAVPVEELSYVVGELIAPRTAEFARNLLDAARGDEQQGTTCFSRSVIAGSIQNYRATGLRCFAVGYQLGTETKIH